MVLGSPAAALADRDHQEQSTKRGGGDNNRGGAKQQASHPSDGKQDDGKKDDNKKKDDKNNKADKPAARSTTPAPSPKPSSSSKPTAASSPSRPSGSGTAGTRQPDDDDQPQADDDGPQTTSPSSTPKRVFVPPPTVVTAPPPPTPRPATVLASAPAVAAPSAAGSASSSSSRTQASSTNDSSADAAVASAGDAASASVEADASALATDQSMSDATDLALLDVPLPPVIGDLFAELGAGLGSWLGQPLAPAETTADSCDVQQPTTLGLALWNCASQVSSFFSTDGRHRWAVLDGRLVQWLGASVADPIDLSGAVAPAPWNLVCIGLNANEQDACVIGGGTVTGGVIDQPGADRVYLFDVEGGPARAHVDLADLPADYDLYLVDGSSEVLAGSAQEGTQAESVDAVLQPGPYLLYVHSDPGRDVDPTLPFLLHLDLSPPPPPA